jgi:short-subunit dehydrogenase
MAREQVVVITGASSGIGRDAALRFAKGHSRLVLVSRRRDVLDQVAAECERRGAPAAIAIAADVSDDAQLQTVVDTAIASFGRIDVWVNDAGVDAYGPLDRMHPDEVRRVFETNAIGTTLGTRAALRAMKPSGRGTIVNVASVLAEVPQPYAAVYSASKAAIRALSAAVRSELRLEKLRGIHVTTVLPATIDTPIFRHAVNRSGRGLRALPPVYPASTAGKAIVKAARTHPQELHAGSVAKGFVPMHRAAPRITEAELALLTQRTQFTAERAPGTSGNVFEPFPDADASIAGGWHGGARRRVRQLLLLTALAVPIWQLVRMKRKAARR